MNNYIILISAIGTYYLSLLIHELGHYIPSLLFGYKPKMEFDEYGVPCRVLSYSFNFNKYKLKIMSVFGILLGFIPIYIFYKLLISEGQLSSIFIGFIGGIYILACSQDFKDLIFGQIKQRKLSEF